MLEWLRAMDNLCDYTNIISLILVLLFLWQIKPKWLESVRSILAVMLGYSFCYGFLIKLIEPKDFLLIVSMAFNFYFLVKKRVEENGGPK